VGKPISISFGPFYVVLGLMADNPFVKLMGLLGALMVTFVLSTLMTKITTLQQQVADLSVRLDKPT
jgi:hypothetical protein